MDAEQQMDIQSGCFDQEEHDRLVSNLIDRINKPSEEVKLSKHDKLTISYGLKLLRLELSRETCLTPE